MSSSNSTDDSQLQLQYNYIPTEWICITFLSLFSISTVIHAVQTYRSRLWWLIPSAILCGLLEVIGWSGRLWSSQNPYLFKPYLLQAVTLIIAPTPLVAANFILLGRFIQRLGPQYSRLTPRLYTIIFVSCDIIALAVQGMGGGIASGAQNNPSQATTGANIALGGTIFQLVAIIGYCSLAAEFFYRYKWDLPLQRWASRSNELLRGTADGRLKRLLQAMLIMTVFIMIRTVYRVIEFSNGWNGTVISTQWLFNVFDGAMIILAFLTLNLFHPGVYLREDDQPDPASTELGELREGHEKLRPISTGEESVTSGEAQEGHEKLRPLSNGGESITIGEVLEGPEKLRPISNGEESITSGEVREVHEKSRPISIGEGSVTGSH